jgi:hypothetical protein
LYVLVSMTGAETAPPAALEELLQHKLFGAAGQEAVAKFAEHRNVKARIRQGESEQVFPIDTSPHRLGGLAISKVFAELPNGDERQAPGREARLAIEREAGGKVVVPEDRAQGIPQEQVGIAFGKGGPGHSGGFSVNAPRQQALIISMLRRV